jgi:UDP-glucose 4-epimerase
MENFKYLLVIGGTGILGSAIVKVFKNNSSNWKICVLDYADQGVTRYV